jgi:hypothetical protein
VHAAENDQLVIGLCRFLAERQRIPHDIGQILNFRNLVIMCQDERTALTTPVVDLVDERLFFELAAMNRIRSHTTP